LFLCFDQSFLQKCRNFLQNHWMNGKVIPYRTNKKLGLFYLLHCTFVYSCNSLICVSQLLKVRKGLYFHSPSDLTLRRTSCSIKIVLSKSKLKTSTSKRVKNDPRNMRLLRSTSRFGISAFLFIFTFLGFRIHSLV
jgi:hypothetical protein